MKELVLSDKDIFALCKVLTKAMDTAENCLEGVRHARIVTFQLQQYVEQRLKEEGADYEGRLHLNK